LGFGILKALPTPLWYFGGPSKFFTTGKLLSLVDVALGKVNLSGLNVGRHIPYWRTAILNKFLSLSPLVSFVDVGISGSEPL
jgi:hypothetical protein